MQFPPGSLQGPKVETKKALLLIDFQNDFTAGNGKLPVPNIASFLPRLPNLIAKFREQGQVVWVRTLFQQPCPAFSPSIGSYNVMLKSIADYIRQNPRQAEYSNAGPVLDDDNDPALKIQPSIDADPEAFLNPTITSAAKRCCLPDTHGAELCPQLASCFDKQKDLMLTKSQYSLFTGPMIVMQLRARLITDLYICGSLSNVGVYATVLDAVQQGFNVTLIEDCLGFRHNDCHFEAMTQMADAFGANGIDYSELMDDLHGLLGDVVPASRYTRTFQLSMQPPTGSRLTSSQRVNQWMNTIESESDEADSTLEPSATTFDPIRALEGAMAKTPAPPTNESPAPPLNHRASPIPSPPRKRSTSDRDDSDENESLGDRPLHRPPPPRSHPEDYVPSKPSTKKSRRESATSKTSRDSNQSAPRSPKSQLNAVGHSQSTGHLEISKKVLQDSQSAGRAMSLPGPPQIGQTPRKSPRSKNTKNKFDPTYLGPDDAIGEDDSRIVHDVLSVAEADKAFSALKLNTAWQKMYHRSGEVPRLVAVQGIVAEDEVVPIYRHPADESPPLRPFDDTVDWLRKQCEILINHPLNHVLIQHYRSGEDNISEHSDKTLDIVRGSSIVNLSLGAMRTMTLRTKKMSQSTGLNEAGEDAKVVDVAPRTTHRIRLPHNSLFVLGERTNANWLHSIKADKRPESEKSREELDFEGERISLTFRHIGTFIDPRKQTIFGQGATSKTRGEAKSLLVGKAAEAAGEQMIIGFGKENHLNDSEFDWQEVYGTGFDVVNFEITADQT